MLITAFVAYQNDRDVAALVAVAAAALPVIVTAIAAWWERRHMDAIEPTPVVGD